MLERFSNQQGSPASERAPSEIKRCAPAERGEEMILRQERRAKFLVG